MSHKQKILFILVIGIILIGIFGFLIFNNTSVPSEEDKNNISIIENYSKPTIYETTTYKFEPTSKPNFNVGETYHYRITTYLRGGMPEGGITKITLLPIDIFIHVEKIERINKTNCYVLKRDKANCTTEIYRDNKITGKKDKTFFIEIYTDEIMWINAENGSVVKVEFPFYNFSRSKAKITHSPVITLPFVPYFEFFNDRMLCLKENTKWTYEAKGKDPEVGDIEGKSEMRVTGIEKINGRKCFVYEDIGYTKTTSATNVLTLNTKNIYWVDVEKRIMVKQKVIEDGLTLLEAELVEITK